MSAVFALPIVSMTVQKAIAEDLSFTLKNATSSPLVEFYVEAMSQSDWGEDILTDSVKPGESGNVTIADGKTTCIYGIRGVFADGDVLEEENLDLCKLGSYTYTEK
ncbi:hypothetical protein H6F43_12665 [Leptolyngbya sp. FACHB-36]|nr:hypothetical protein [Leptolyngbya sp. FACHB-36]